MLWDLMKGIYEQEKIPTEWRDSVIIPIYNRVRTHPGKPGIYWNLIIGIPGLEYTGISSKVLENTGI